MQVDHPRYAGLAHRSSRHPRWLRQRHSRRQSTVALRCSASRTRRSDARQNIHILLRDSGLSRYAFRRPISSKTRAMRVWTIPPERSEELTSELQSRGHLVCRLLLEKKKKSTIHTYPTG